MSGPAGFAADQLRSFVERLERLQEEIDSINEDKRDAYAEAKGSGFDVKIIREVLKIRRQDKSEREEREAVLDLYLQALEGTSHQASRRNGAPSAAMSEVGFL